MLLHYENLPMQYTEIFSADFIRKKKEDIFLIFAQNIDHGYTLEPPWRGGSNEYPQSMFWTKNKKPQFSIYKWGSWGYTCHRNVILVLKMKWKIGLQHHTFVAACRMEIGIDTDCTGRKQSFYH